MQTQNGSSQPQLAHKGSRTDTKRRQETRSGSRPCAIQARFARPPPRRMAAWLLLSPPVASKTTPGRDRQPLWLGIENPASGAGGSASTAGLRASEGTMVWAAGTYRTWQLDQPRICEATLQSLTGTHGTAPLQRRKSRQTRTLRDLRTIAGAADEAADGTRGNLIDGQSTRARGRGAVPPCHRGSPVGVFLQLSSCTFLLSQICRDRPR